MAKVRDVVGIYLSPPENALVLAVDEKSQIQALDRTQPVLPMAPTVPARMTHDYVRHGTTSLFAALDITSGSVIAQHYRRHRHQEFLRFLKVIDAAVPQHLELHLVLDNYATHKTEPVKKWLLRHPRFHLHFAASRSVRSRTPPPRAEVARRRPDAGRTRCPASTAGRPPASAPVTARARAGAAIQSVPTSRRPQSKAASPHDANGRIITLVTPEQDTSTRSCYELLPAPGGPTRMIRVSGGTLRNCAAGVGSICFTARDDRRPHPNCTLNC